MKNKEVIKILNALQRISAAKYELSIGAIHGMGRNIRKLSDIKEDLDATQNKLVKAVLKEGEAGLPQGDARAIGVLEQLGELYEQESGYVPFKFKMESLRLDVNKTFSPDDLATIFPLIDEDPASNPMPAAGGV